MRNFLLLSTAVMIPAVAHSADLSIPTYTHHTPVELASISPLSGTEIKLAAVCFLGNGCGNDGNGGYNKGDEDTSIDPAKQCQNEGFTYTSSNCTLPNFLGNKCTYNSNYYGECKQDIPRACKESGYAQIGSCASGQKLKASPRCPWDNSYGICCKESCPSNSSLTCTGGIAGDDTCGYICKQCCSVTCPSGYDYTESQLTGESGNGWIKDGNDSCDSCARGKLYKRKPAPIPAGYRTCNCGGANPFVSAGTTYYSSCNCCPSCSSDYNCGSCGSYTTSNGCGGTCNRCYTPSCSGTVSSCPSNACKVTENNGCGGSCSYCKTKNSYDTSNCACGTSSCSDGCGGSVPCCKSCSYTTSYCCGAPECSSKYDVALSYKHCKSLGNQECSAFAASCRGTIRFSMCNHAVVQGQTIYSSATYTCIQ